MQNNIKSRQGREITSIDAGTRKRVEEKLIAYQTARKIIRTEKSEISKTKKHLKHLHTAQTVAQSAARQVQESAHRNLADVVSRSLAAVFDEPYTFKIKFEEKRNRTEASLIFERDGQEIDPMSASGGGVVDVAAFALRLSCLMLSNPPLRRLLVLDEPMKMLAVAHRERVRDLLVQLSKELNVQFLIVTHSPEIECGKIIRL